MPLFDCAEVETVTREGKAKTIRACPVCQAKGIIEEISTRTEKFGAVPVLVSYLCENGCKPARDERRHNDPDPKKRAYFEQYDLGKLREIEARDIPYWYPTNKMMNVEDDSKPWGAEWREGRNFRTVAELFTKRNLWALSAIREAIGASGESTASGTLLFAFSAILLNCSNMYQYRPSLKGGFQKGTYYVPQDSQIINVWRAMRDKIHDIENVLPTLPSHPSICISTQSSTFAPQLPTSSIDYIFTDPPYGANVQYGELNFVWEAWLGLDTHWQDDEIIVNGVRGKTEADWADMMRLAMSECYRVLKQGRAISVCYHDTSDGTWQLLQDLMAEAGFVAEQTDSAIYIDTGQKSYNQLTADKVTKRDLVINFRKPRPGEVRPDDMLISGDEDERTFGEKARAIIREYLAANPGATKDRVYDAVVSHMVRSGSMEAHDFGVLLAQVAEEVREPVRKNLFENEAPNLFGTHEVGHWFLKETDAAASVDAAESAREDAAARNLTAFLAEYHKRHPSKDGAHYSDLFERYIYTVREKPRRALQDWLPDYFYKTDEGTWRAPANDEEMAAKTHARANGVTRRIKRYLAYLDQGVAVPVKERPSDATLVEWIRHCRRAGLYEQGMRLYEQGGMRLDRLDEEARVAVEEDYQVCVRQLARAKNAGATKKAK